MIRSGELRERVTFQRMTEVSKPGGGFQEIPVTYLETFASVRQEAPGADIIAQQQNLSGVLKVRIRYNPEIEIKVGDIILWRDFTLTALEPQVDYLRRFITIRSLSAIETTGR